jgi:hypothetical protein
MHLIINKSELRVESLFPLPEKEENGILLCSLGMKIIFFAKK